MKVRFSLAAVCLLFTACAACGSSSETNRITLAIALRRDEKAAGDASIQSVAAQMIYKSLAFSHALRICPDAPNAMLQISTNSEPIIRDEKLAALVGAKFVAVGSLTGGSDDCRISMRIFDAASRNYLPELNVTATNWIAARDEVLTNLFGRLDVKPSATEWEKMKSFLAKSPGAVTNIAESIAAFNRADWPVAERVLRSVLQTDPSCEQAWTLLANVTLNAGNPEEGERCARKALDLNPESSDGHAALGSVLWYEHQEEAGLVELREALLLDPSNPTPRGALAWIYHAKGDLAREAQQYEGLKQIDRFNVENRLKLATLYSLLFEPEKARVELDEIATLHAANDVWKERSLLQQCVGLHFHREALECIGRLDAMTTRANDDLKPIVTMEKLFYSTNFITNSPPPVESWEDLTSQMAKELSPDQLALVRNPFETTDEMRQWSLAIVSGATNDWQKAWQISEALSHRPDFPGDIPMRTAREDFAAWRDTNATFFCQDYAFLYVALARAAGLRAYFCFVGEDGLGNRNWHACAAVFLNDKSLLVDPMFGWFGAAHHTFQIFSDRETAAYFVLCGDTVDHALVAHKLEPKLLAVEFNYCAYLIATGKYDELASEIPLLKSYGENDEIYRAQAALSEHEGKIDEAVSNLEHSIARSPTVGASYMDLADLYTRHGYWSQATNSFGQALHCAMRESMANRARNAIVEIAKKIGSTGTPESGKEHK